MNIDIQIIYILVLIFTCLVLLFITLIYLYISTLNKYTKIRTAGLSEKDESVINSALKSSENIIKKAEEEASKIVFNAKSVDEKVEQKIAKTIDQIVSKWTQNADTIFAKNVNLLDSELKRGVEDLYKKETSNLQLYKEEKIKEFDELISDYIKKISKKIITKEIDLNDHKKLINDSLERAKANGLFK